MIFISKISIHIKHTLITFLCKYTICKISYSRRGVLFLAGMCKCFCFCHFQNVTEEHPVIYNERLRIKATKMPKGIRKERDRASKKDFSFTLESLYQMYIPPMSQVPENLVSITKPVAQASFSMWHQEW